MERRKLNALDESVHEKGKLDLRLIYATEPIRLLTDLDQEQSAHDQARLGLFHQRIHAVLRALILAFCLLAAPAFAETEGLTIAQDRYEAGASVRFDGPAGTDLFMAGNRVAVAAPVAGSAHLAGRRVTIEAAVAGDVFAAGYSVAVSGGVGGDATVTGYEVSVGPVTGNLRAAGSEVVVGPVGGYALITGEEVTLNGTFAGDVVLLSDHISYAPGATVSGALTIYADDPARVVVPASVAPAERVRIEDVKDYRAGDWTDRMPVKVSVWRIVTGFLSGVLISGLIAALVIAIAPKAVQNWRAVALAHPGRAIWPGDLVWLSGDLGAGRVRVCADADDHRGFPVAGHSPLFEEPQRAREILVQDVLHHAVRLSDKEQ